MKMTVAEINFQGDTVLIDRARYIKPAVYKMTPSSFMRLYRLIHNCPETVNGIFLYRTEVGQ